MTLAAIEQPNSFDTAAIDQPHFLDTIPHRYSPDALQRRRERDRQRGYLVPRPPIGRYVAVPHHLHAAAHHAVRSLDLHCRHDFLAEQSHHHARLAILAAHGRHLIDDREARGALAVHRAAGRLKHTFSALAKHDVFQPFSTTSAFDSQGSVQSAVIATAVAKLIEPKLDRLFQAIESLVQVLGDKSPSSASLGPVQEQAVLLEQLASTPSSAALVAHGGDLVDGTGQCLMFRGSASDLLVIAQGLRAVNGTIGESQAVFMGQGAHKDLGKDQGMHKDRHELRHNVVTAAIGQTYSFEPAATEQPYSLEPAATEQPYSVVPAAIEQPYSLEPAATEQPYSLEPAATEQPYSVVPAATEQQGSLDTDALIRDSSFAFAWLQHPTFEFQVPGAGVTERAAIRDFFIEQGRLKEEEILKFVSLVRRQLESDGDGSCKFARQQLPRLSKECQRKLTRELDSAEAACLSARCPGRSPSPKTPTRSKLKAITKR